MKFSVPDSASVDRLLQPLMPDEEDEDLTGDSSSGASTPHISSPCTSQGKGDSADHNSASHDEDGKNNGEEY